MAMKPHQLHYGYKPTSSLENIPTKSSQLQLSTSSSLSQLDQNNTHILPCNISVDFNQLLPNEKCQENKVNIKNASKHQIFSHRKPHVDQVIYFEKLQVTEVTYNFEKKDSFDKLDTVNTVIARIQTILASNNIINSQAWQDMSKILEQYDSLQHQSSPYQAIGNESEISRIIAHELIGQLPRSFPNSQPQLESLFFYSILTCKQDGNLFLACQGINTNLLQLLGSSPQQATQVFLHRGFPTFLSPKSALGILSLQLEIIILLQSSSIQESYAQLNKIIPVEMVTFDGVNFECNLQVHVAPVYFPINRSHSNFLLFFQVETQTPQQQLSSFVKFQRENLKSASQIKNSRVVQDCFSEGISEQLVTDKAYITQVERFKNTFYFPTNFSSTF